METRPTAIAVLGGSGAVLRDAAYYMKDGLEKELRGDYEKALRSYSAALGEDPLCIDAWCGQLWMLLAMGDSVEARIWADRALQSYPNDPDILSLKALAHWRNGLKAEAKLLNDTALAMTRESANVWLSRAAMQMDEDVKSALACFAHACRTASDGGLVRIRAGELLLARKKYAEALKFLREATQRLPDSAWAWYGYGCAQRALGREEIALSAFDRACNLAPGDGRYQAALRKKGGIVERIRRRLFGERKG